MKTNERTTAMQDAKVYLSTLWVFVLFNMIFADIVGFMNPGALAQIISGDAAFEITQGLLLIFAILLEIPIAMVFLTRVMSYRASRWANVFAGVITILFVVGGGNTSLSYLFFASIEVVTMAYIVWYAWHWSTEEVGPTHLSDNRSLRPSTSP